MPHEITDDALRAEARGDSRERSDSEGPPTRPVLEERGAVEAQFAREILRRPTPCVSEAEKLCDELGRVRHRARVGTSPF